MWLYNAYLDMQAVVCFKAYVNAQPLQTFTKRRGHLLPSQATANTQFCEYKLLINRVAAFGRMETKWTRRIIPTAPYILASFIAGIRYPRKAIESFR